MNLFKHSSRTPITWFKYYRPGNVVAYYKAPQIGTVWRNRSYVYVTRILYIHTHTHTHTYTHTYIYLSVEYKKNGVYIYIYIHIHMSVEQKRDIVNRQKNIVNWFFGKCTNIIQWKQDAVSDVHIQNKTKP